MIQDLIKTEIGTRVVKVISSSLSLKTESVKTMTYASKLVADLGADSLDVVEMVMEFETEFNIEIPDEDAQTIETVGNAIAYITDKTNSKETN